MNSTMNNTDIETLKRALNIGGNMDVIETYDLGEELVKCMEKCSNQMKIIAQQRESATAEYIKYLVDATRDWTKVRSDYAAQYLRTELSAAKDMRVQDIQAQIDAAKMAHDWKIYNDLLPEIENLRNERARFEKWARDNKKMV